MAARKLHKIITLLYAAIFVLTLMAIYPEKVAASNGTVTFTNQRSPVALTNASSQADQVNDSERESSNLNATQISPEEKAMVKLINQERMEAGLDVLEIDPILVKLARDKSRDMVIHNYFGHNSPRLGTVYDQLKKAGVIYQMTAENLSGAPNCFKAQYYLMRSPVHRSNILNSGYKKIGIGIVRGGPYGKMITQIFLG